MTHYLCYNRGNINKDFIYLAGYLKCSNAIILPYRIYIRMNVPIEDNHTITECNKIDIYDDVRS